MWCAEPFRVATIRLLASGFIRFYHGDTEAGRGKCTETRESCQSVPIHSEIGSDCHLSLAGGMRRRSRRPVVFLSHIHCERTADWAGQADQAVVIEPR